MNKLNVLNSDIENLLFEVILAAYFSPNYPMRDWENIASDGIRTRDLFGTFQDKMKDQFLPFLKSSGHFRLKWPVKFETSYHCGSYEYSRIWGVLRRLAVQTVNFTS